MDGWTGTRTEVKVKCLGIGDLTIRKDIIRVMPTSD